MGSLSPPKLPIIDLSIKDLKPGTTTWYSTRTQVRKALEEFGCFQAVYNGVSLDLHNALFGALKQAFDLPVQTKRLNTSDKLYYGYIGQIAEMPLHEGLGIEEPSDFQQVQNFTNILWAEGNATFCETVHSYANQMVEMEQLVKRMIFESLGVEKYYQSFNESTAYLLRIMKYKKPRTKETTVGANTHTDGTFITILHQNQVNGLEIETKEGEWICHTASPNSFVVMIGESLMAWSNDRLHSPRHRVMLSGDNDRYSTALFSSGKGMIQTPEELVDEEHPLLYKPFDQIGLNHFYYTKELEEPEGPEPVCFIKAYCGI